MQGASFPHDQRIRLRLCFTESSLCPASQPRIRLHLQIRHTASKQNEKAAGSAGREQCTALSPGGQADSIPVSGSASDKAMPGQHVKARNIHFAPLPQETNAAVAGIQPADHAAGPQLQDPPRLPQAEPLGGTEISAVHVTVQLQVLEEQQQPHDKPPLQVSLVVSRFMLSWPPACA